MEIEVQATCSAVIQSSKRRCRHAGANHAGGVEVPRGIGGLTALHTLGVVDVRVAGGYSILEELKNLTQLRKLEVVGINRRNSQLLCSAISSHGHLESLSVRLENDTLENDKQGFYGYLDGISPPPEKLVSLKLYGLADRLPVWVMHLRKLNKLDLDMTILTLDDLHVLGKLPYLFILRLHVKLIQDGELRFCLKPEDKAFGRPSAEPFENLQLLKIACSSRLHVIFGEWVMQNLELLKVRCCSGSSLRFSDLECLTELKEFSLKGSCDDTLKHDLEQQLAEHHNRPVLKLE